MKKDKRIANVGKKLTANDFVTMCNVCNEGAKNKNIGIVTLLDKVKKSDKDIQKEIFDFLKTKFS